MTPDVALARLAGKSGFRVEAPIVGGGDHLSVHDISAACSGLKRDSYILALALWAADYSVLGELVDSVEWHTAKVARQNKWKIPKGKTIITNMTNLAISEVVLQHKFKCKFCTNGFIYHEKGEVKACKLCKGNPHGHLSTRDRAKILGVDESNMRRNWALKYEPVYRYVLDLRNTAWSHIKNGLQSPQC